MTGWPWDDLTPRIVRYAAEECGWQQSGEQSVAWMVDGWRYANRHQHKAVTLRDVLVLGRLVEPRHNQRGLRQIGVQVGWDVKLPWRQVPAALNALLAATDLEPTEWFREYEEIHPFRDGNGRTGSILFNWRRGWRSLMEPIHPPNLWHDPRRNHPGYPVPGCSR
jgi:hypothetical protein